MAMVQSDKGAARKKAKMPVPTPTMVPAIGRISAIIERGLKTRLNPKNIKPNPTSLTIHVRVLLEFWACSNMEAAE